MSNLSPLLNVLNKSLRISGKKIIRDFSEIEKLQSSIKNTDKYVNIAKSNLENDIYLLLKKIKPDLDIFTYGNSKYDNNWLINTIDSPVNFSRGIENFCINVSLKENDKITTCIIYNPIRDEIFNFQNGLGSFKNDYRIRVSERKRLNESVVSFYNQVNKKDQNNIIGNIRQIIKANNIETRESGSIYSDVCHIASGKIDCFLLPKQNIDLKKNFTLILSESGGMMSELKINDQEICIVSNKYIGKIIKEMIENRYETR